MKTGSVRAAMLLAASSLLALGAAQASDSARHEAQAMEKAKISLTQAIHMAERQGNGQAISAEYEFKNGDPAYYEVKVLRDDGQKIPTKLSGRSRSRRGIAPTAADANKAS